MMSSVVFDPEPMNVDEDALRSLEDYAKAKGVTAEIVLAGMIDALKPREHDDDGYPIVHVDTAYRFPRSGKTGHVILPADWDDPEDAVYDRYADE
ncbi:hypothetical protein [Bifidobacterium simiarum]|uniref:hypothetical protein n=1 Tax=Bifidobacterium simiarum TaxID=2045441 RepID=UPI001BDD0C7B|nr:hypothetical protein [Bifidobacterium simiarum]MBT1165393.1 hypothetical protein [Bifidobacterium simiarum]